MRPKISVIMAAHNAERFIEEAIRSVLNQTFKDFELLVSSDGSTDNTVNIVKLWKKTDNRIKLIKSKKKRGRAKARNAALKIAKGKYIAILDSDDIAMPDRLEKQFKYMEKNPDVFLCGGGSFVIDEEGKLLGKRRAVKKVSKVLPHFNPFNHSTVIYRNKSYRYREKFLYCEDYDFFLLIFSDGNKLVNLNDFLVKWRIHKGWSTNPYFYNSGLKVKQFFRERMETGKDSYDKFDLNSIKPKTKSYTSNSFIEKIKLRLWSNYFIRTFIYEVEARVPEITIMLVNMIEDNIKEND